MLTPGTLAAMFLFFQVLHAATRLFVQRLVETAMFKHYVPDIKTRAALREQMPSYILSTLHALYVTPRGLNHLTTLFRAPIPLKLHNPTIYDSPDAYTLQRTDARFFVQIEGVTLTNLVLAGYLLSDLIQILRHYPNLGSIDAVLHHITFFYCAAILGHFQLFPFMFGWLIVGESSTPFLNVRWFLIKAGYGHTTFLKVTELIFAFLFFSSRFALYSAGLFYQIAMLPNVPSYIPNWAVYSAMAFVIIGFFLNVAWLTKILRIAANPTRHKTKQSTASKSSITIATTKAQPDTETVKQD